MKKRVWSWLLPVLMVLAQQGAYLHELGHLRAPAEQGQGAGPSQGQGQDRKQAADKLCEACLAYSHLAHLSAPERFAPSLQNPTFGFDAVVAIADAAADVVAPRSRGPPLSL